MTQSKPPLITLLTDFGTRDHYVASMKGVIYDTAPDAVVVDISHDVPAQDLWATNFLLQATYHHFPARTIHVCVVDPGVGTSRRAIIVSTDRYLFVAPDNGILSCIYEREEAFHVFEVTSAHYFRNPVSRTFHGRDVFAPVAAWLARGIEPPNFGPGIDNPIRLELPKVRRVGDREFIGTVLYTDRFGNLVTNLPSEDMEKVVEKGSPPFRFLVGDQQVTQYRQSYGEADAGQLFGISGSSGYVEFSVRDGSAAAVTGARRGDDVRLLFG